MVKVNGISVIIKDTQILHNVSCTLAQGRITLFIGPSGAGKTTLLKSIVGLTPLQNGTILLNNQSLVQLSNYERAQKVGFLFQDFNLFPCMTVLENCIDALLIHGMSRTDAEQQVYPLLEKMGLLKFAHKYPADLSGGQKQRVAIGRMLALKPAVILLDEPSASLDPVNTDILVTILKDLAAANLTIGISTQDMAFAQKVMDRIYFLEDGKIVEFCDMHKQQHECKKITRFLHGLLALIRTY